MDANSKDFEVEIMAQEQLSEKIFIHRKPETATIP
jgi:hypothetical protein